RVGNFPDCFRRAEAARDRSDAERTRGMRAGDQVQPTGRCVHARTAGEHAGVLDGDDGTVRRDYPHADGRFERRGEVARESDYAAGEKGGYWLKSESHGKEKKT